MTKEDLSNPTIPLCDRMEAMRKMQSRRIFSVNELVGIDADNEDTEIYARRCRERGYD